MIRAGFFLLFLFAGLAATAQTITQTIKGTVLDADSRAPLEGATVFIPGSEPPKGCVTDDQGMFRIEGVPVGRVTLVVRYLGYSEMTLSEVRVTSSKEVVLEIPLTEKVVEGEEVVISGEDEKTGARNEMAAVSTRQFTIEETNRYAGGWGDPSRMAANFAGVVSNNDERNDIVVRGNSPVGVLWRLDGVDIPNPNHFTTSGASGGGISMLNNNTLENSDFMTGAYPSEYGNVTSAVFDLRLRKGNMDQREYLVGFGPNGIEFGCEGPFVKGKPFSYMINYRLSSMKLITQTGLLKWIGGVPHFSDLNFKFHFRMPHGYFSLFGIAGASTIEFKAVEDSLAWAANTGSPFNEIFGSKMSVMGLTYMHLFNDKTYLRTTVIGAGSQTTFKEDSLNLSYTPLPSFKINMAEGRNSASLYLNHKVNARHTLRAGTILSHLWYNMGIRDFVYQPEYREDQIFGYVGNSMLAQAYAHWKYSVTDQVTINGGAHFTWFELNNRWAAEPRFSVSWKAHPRHTVAVGLGRHSRMLPAGIYFGQTRDDLGNITGRPNTGLDFIRSDQAIFTYDYVIAPKLRLKAEAYVQRMYAAPVSAGTQDWYSGLNAGADFSNIVASEALKSTGTGRNAGLEVTVEKFFSNHFYFLVTGSLYDSRYKGSDGVLRSTVFNGNYSTNALGGYEIVIGKKKRNFLNLSGTVMYAGGRRLIPIDLEASRAAGTTVLVYEDAFTERARDYFRADVRVAFRNNQKKFSHEIAVDVRNVFNHQNIFQREYDPETDSIQYSNTLGFFPMVFYRFEF